jgi:hypothetical protein
MPKISQYTVVEPQGEDKIIITQTIGSPENATKNITIDDLKEYINQGGGGNGVASLNTLTGNVTLVAGANVIIANDLNDTLTISVPNAEIVSLQNALDNGNSWTDGLQTYEFNLIGGSGELSYINTDENWGWSINGEEGLFLTDGNGNPVGKSGIITNSIFVGNGSHQGSIRSTNITSSRTFQLPDASGTIALTSDIADVSEWAESTGTRAGGDLRLNLGDYDESSNGTRISIKDNDSLVDIYGEVKFYNNPSIMNDAGTFGSRLSASNITSNKTLLIPDSDGTIALTSDLSSLSADQEIADFNATIGQVGVMVDVDSATDVVVTVRDFATEAIPVGSVLTYRQAGVGKISNAYSVATGDTSTTYREGDVLTLWQKSQDNWVVINPPHAIDSQTVGEPSGSDQVLNVVSLTQAQYDAGSHNADTLYVITS